MSHHSPHQIRIVYVITTPKVTNINGLNLCKPTSSPCVIIVARSSTLCSEPLPTLLLPGSRLGYGYPGRNSQKLHWICHETWFLSSVLIIDHRIFLYVIHLLSYRPLRCHRISFVWMIIVPSVYHSILHISCHSTLQTIVPSLGKHHQAADMVYFLARSHLQSVSSKKSTVQTRRSVTYQHTWYRAWNAIVYIVYIRTLFISPFVGPIYYHSLICLLVCHYSLSPLYSYSDAKCLCFRQNASISSNYLSS